MRKLLLSLFALSLFALAAQGQNVRFEVPIQGTGGSVTDTLDDNTVVTLLLSSDDCEQENDEIDTPYDDDLDAGWEGAPEDQNILTTGLRFRDILIPQGATIDSAFIMVWSHEGKSTEDEAEITIWAEATDHAETFNETDLITDRTPTSAKVKWTVAEEWVIWQPYKTIDIAPVIQEVVNRSGWEAGNAIALVLQGEDQGPSDVENAREFEAFENISDPEDVDPDGNPGDGKNHPERVPRLVVYYSAPQYLVSMPIQTTGGTVTDTLDDNTVVTLQLSSDDCEQENDEIDTPYDDDLDAGWEGAPEDQNILTVGLRFRDINIPQGARIDSAFVQVWSHEGKSPEDEAEIILWGEATDDAETFNETDLITDRTPTASQLTWTVDTEWIIWQAYKTMDIAPIIQEIVDRPGWTPGNALAIVMQGQDQGPSDVENAREFEAFENISDPEDVDPDGNPGDGMNHPERVPRLWVYFSLPTSLDKVDAADYGFSVYPNPASNGLVNVRFNEDAFTQINIYNIAGQKVRSFETYESAIQLNVSDLNDGVYFVNAIRGNVSLTQKLIVK